MVISIWIFLLLYEVFIFLQYIQYLRVIGIIDFKKESLNMKYLCVKL